MAVLTQGTHLFVVDPNATGGAAVVRIKKATAFNPGANPADQIEDTDLEETNTRTYLRGLRTPGQGNMTLNADPAEPSHVLLHEMAESDQPVMTDIIVGWADGTSAPTIDTEGNLVFPSDRTFYHINAYVSDFPFDFQTNALVATEATFQRSGRGYWKRKGEAAA